MSRVKIGGIYEIKTTRGYGYFQCMHSTKERGDLIKVFNYVFPVPQEHIDKIIEVKNWYYAGFMVGITLRLKLIQFVGETGIPSDFSYPKYMRTDHFVKGSFLGWHIIETSTLQRKLIEELTPEQKKLSPYGIISAAFLIDQLDEGWNLENWGKGYEVNKPLPILKVPEETTLDTPALSKKDTSSSKADNPYFPFELSESDDEFQITVSIESPDLYPKYYDFFLKHDYEGNGYCWEGHIVQILEKLDKKLLKHIEFDPEAGSFTAVTDTKENQKKFAELLSPIFSDLKKLGEWVKKADRSRIDD